MGRVSLSNDFIQKGDDPGALVAEILTLVSLLLDFDCLGEVFFFFPLDGHPHCTVVDVVASVAELILSR